MIKQEREIYFTNDLDGVHIIAPLPVRRTLKILRGEFSLPLENSEVIEYQFPEGFVQVALSKCSVFFHRIRLVDRNSLKSLEVFKKTAEDNKRKLRMVALSGRERDKHAITVDQLKRAGYMEYFEELFLNKGENATIWKESIVRKLVNDGFNVVHVDDDLRVGFCVARIDKGEEGKGRVLVYIIKNISNHRILLNKAGIIVPDNLIFVDDLKEAAGNFSKRLSEGFL